MLCTILEFCPSDTPPLLLLGSFSFIITLTITIAFFVSLQVLFIIINDGLNQSWERKSTLRVKKCQTVILIFFVNLWKEYKIEWRSINWLRFPSGHIMRTELICTYMLLRSINVNCHTINYDENNFFESEWHFYILWEITMGTGKKFSLFCAVYI